MLRRKKEQFESQRKIEFHFHSFRSLFFEKAFQQDLRSKASAANATRDTDVLFNSFIYLINIVFKIGIS